jgi:superfamily II RNA helicase
MAHPTLAERVPAGPLGADEVLDRFIDWVHDEGLEPYPAQEEALLELMAERHVILGTPTGSGKSLVALGLHFKARCEGRRSFYTAPTKALVNEKFFALCEELGAQHVGMLTGDASINRGAPVLCCTAEVLSNMALREGSELDAPYVVMDEFHFYGDRARGAAWQIPLLILRDTTFLLMSATLGNPARIAERIERETRREIACVFSEQRPVPLDFEYRETPMHETVETLLEQERSPLYLVHFTQRECAEQAQGLVSARVASGEQRKEIARALEDFHFDTPYGRDMQRLLRQGVGIHHAGLLPKYRLLVEQLSQRGLLNVICGTDTLGLGVNIPIRTVVFSRLSKFDGEKVALLSARDFKQIAGRAGRRGFDDHGWVVCQAPAQVIERKRRDKGRKKPPRRPPLRNQISWTRDTFERLIWRPPEGLEPQFSVSHGMIVNVMQRRREQDYGCGGYRDVVTLIARSHLGEGRKSRLRREAAARFRSLRQAGVIQRVYDPESRRYRVRVSTELQWDFSLHQTLSLFLVDALEALDPQAPDYALDVLTLVEAILDDPVAVLRQQSEKLRRELLARLKAEGVPYEERLSKLDEVTHPKPDAEFIYATFNLFAQTHPWVAMESIRPKSVAREMFEGYRSFDGYVREYQLQRSEGLLLRYLGQVHNTLQQSVPVAARTDEVHDVISYFRTLVARVDRSLLREWESRRDPGGLPATAPAPPRPRLEPGSFAAHVRAQLHALVRTLSEGDYQEAARWVLQPADDPWPPERFEAALAPFLEEYDRVVFEPRARQPRHTLLNRLGPRDYRVVQVLVDPEGENLWCLEGEITLESEEIPEGPLLRLRRIGT